MSDYVLFCDQNNYTNFLAVAVWIYSQRNDFFIGKHPDTVRYEKYMKMIRKNRRYETCKMKLMKIKI